MMYIIQLPELSIPNYYRSMMFCQLIYRFPILLDAATAAVQRKGDTMLLKWADIMTGKSSLFGSGAVLV